MAARTQRLHADHSSTLAHMHHNLNHHHHSHPQQQQQQQQQLHESAQPPRRRRGAARLSCAECRRLKLRCDRKVPCESCVKRGCSAICPDGSLTTGKGNRFVLASTQELHEKISELCSRVRELEDALRETHAQLAEGVHPLLTEELLKVKMPLQRETPSAGPNSTGSGADGPGGGAGPGTAGGKDEEGKDVVDAFGSLSISQNGKTKFYGHTANSWYFLQNESPEEESEDRSAALEQVLPPEVLALGTSFPGSPTASPHAGRNLTTDRFVVESLVAYLPDIERASELRDIYYERASWMYNPVPREHLDNEVFAAFYEAHPQPPTPTAASGAAGAHRLALMLMVLAIGSLMDSHLPAYGIEAEKYHRLARASLFRSALEDEPTLHAVQALFLMSYYLFLVDRHGTSSGSRWIIMGFAVKLAQSIGLHRDSSKFGIEQEEAQQRRETFWELYTYDSWQCLTFGRPPSFSLPHVDCKFPYPAEDPSGLRSFDTWKHRFSAECMSVVHDQAFGAKTPGYQTILSLDRKMRAFPVPAVLQVAGFGGTVEGQGQGQGQGSSSSRSSDSLGLTMQRHIVLAIREMNLLYMHRGFFARAISDSPRDPLGSPYGSSVIAAYRSAGSLIALVKDLSAQAPEPTRRLWFLWTHLFSCAVVLGSIVTKCPTLSLATSSLLQLDSACELFAGVAVTFRAGKVLDIMQNLQQKAHTALEEYKMGRGSPVTSLSLPPSSFRQFSEHGALGHGQASMLSPGSPDTPLTGTTTSSEDAGDDELAKLGGRTRLIKEYRDGKDVKNGNGVAGGVMVKENSTSPTLPSLQHVNGYAAFGAFGADANGASMLNGGIGGGTGNGMGLGFGGANGSGTGVGGMVQPQGAVVPCPLPPLHGEDTSVHPSVVDYLSSFGFAQAQQVQQQHAQARGMYGNGGYSGYDEGASAGPSSASGSGAGTGTLPTPTSPDSSLTLPLPHHQHQHHQHIGGHQQQQQQQQNQSQQQQTYFPPYFPVFDYSSSTTMGPSSASSSGSGSGVADGYRNGMLDQDTAMAYEPEPEPLSVHTHASAHVHHGHHPHHSHGHGHHPHHPHHGQLTAYGRRDAGPESGNGAGGGANMHNTWMDFVNQMSM